MRARLPSWLLSLAPLFLGATLWFAPASTRAAIQAEAPSTLSLQDVEDFGQNGIPDDKWPTLLETMGSADEGNAARELVRGLKPFPAAKLVELLSYPRLSVRLGALDLLEDAAGNTFGFDPWLEDASGANYEPLKQWKSWALKGKPANKTAGGKLTEETFRVIALEIVSGQRERSERAMIRLQAYGLPAISYVEAFLQNQQDLGPAARAALKAAEYRLILQGALPKQAAALARGLAQGTPDNQSSSLPELGHGGATVLPIIADFLESSDPLVRETAVDAAFAAGGRHAVPLIKPLLAKEKVESVLHAMIRGIGAHAPDTGTVQALEPFLKHPSENIVISTIEATAAANVAIYSGPITNCLTDSRWRVRAAALEAVKVRKFDDVKGKVAARLADEDQFVRVSAVGAYAAVAKDNKVLLENFQKHNSLKPAILAALLSTRSEIPDVVWTELAKAPPEIILQCLDTLESRDDHDGKNIRFATPFATHPNADVAAAALRILSSYGRSTGLLLQALDSGNQVKQDAVLDGLHLPLGFFTDAVTTTTNSTSKAVSKLDELYNAFNAAAAASPGTTGAAGPVDPGAQEASPGAMRATLVQFFQSGSARQKLRAALVLGVAGDPIAVRHLLSVYDILSGLDKRTCAGVVSTATDQLDDPRLELALRLLRDPADDVRETAVETWVKYATPSRIGMLLDELVRPEPLIQPDMIYTWEFARARRHPSIAAAIADWSNKTLHNAKAPESVKVFAMVLLSGRDDAQHATIAPFLDSKNPWLRRAAYHSLGLGNAAARLDQILKDESAAVRSTLPSLAAPESNGWKHFFDDSHYVADEDNDGSSYRFSSSRTQFGAWSEAGNGRGTTGVSDEILAALEKLARDPSDMVRFEAQFALLRLGRPVDPAALAALIRLQPEPSNAPVRIGDFLEANYARLGKAYGVLVPLSRGIATNNQPKIFTYFGLSEQKSFASFAALAKLSPATLTKADVAVAPPPAAPATAATGQEFRLVFFFKTGCRDCERTRDLLQRLAGEFPQMIVQEHDISDPKAVVQNEVLSSRFLVASNLHQSTPSVFTQEGALVRDDINFGTLGSLLRKTAAAVPNPGWADVATPDVTTADTAITQRYESFKMGAVVGAGLLDGINPCAFATIIFLLSYLQVARRSPGEILAVGLAFISAVFLTYFAVGLGLAEVLNRLTAMRLAGVVLNYLLAGFALMVAVLCFRDAQLAARGQVGEMTLQLPASLKERIRYTIRTSSRSTRFVVAAFSAGIVVSLLELACTGQVYLPTIQYMLQGGRTSAIGYLLLYNLAFILPLVIVFLLAWIGLRSEDLIRFQKRHTALVKVLTGILFLCLTAFLLFGHDWLSLTPPK